MEHEQDAPEQYAVVKTGGKQYKVATGQVLDVDLLGQDEGAEVSLQPILLVDGSDVLATPAELAKVSVTATVQQEVAAPKINGFTYKSKSNQRRRWGHRQRLSRVEITDISRG